jgi:hypothetical protein
MASLAYYLGGKAAYFVGLGEGVSPVATEAPFRDADFSQYDESQGPHCTSDGTSESVIKYAATGWASKEETESVTLVQVFKLACANYGEKVALRVERPVPRVAGKIIPPTLPREEWTTWTYTRTHTHTHVHTHTHTHTHKRIQSHRYTCTDTHTYTHTYA